MSSKKIRRENKDIIYKERRNNFLNIFIHLIFIGLSITAIYFINSKEIGWFTFIGPITLMLFSIIEIVKSISLSISLKRSLTKINESVIEKDVYKMMHKKKVTNFWDMAWLISLMVLIFVVHTIIMYATKWAPANQNSPTTTFIILTLQIFIPLLWALSYDQLLFQNIKDQNKFWKDDKSIMAEARMVKKESNSIKRRTTLILIMAMWVLPLFSLLNKNTRENILN